MYYSISPQELKLLDEYLQYKMGPFISTQISKKSIESLCGLLAKELELFDLHYEIQLTSKNSPNLDFCFTSKQKDQDLTKLRHYLADKSGSSFSHPVPTPVLSEPEEIFCNIIIDD